MTRVNGIHTTLLYANSAAVTSAQLQNEGLSTRFFSGATDLRSLAGMSLGSLAYQSTKLILSNAIAFPWMRLLAPAMALSAEVSTVQASNSFFYGNHTSDWRSTWIHFACLKISSPLLSPQNIFLRHVGQSFTLVTGAEICGRIGLSDREHGSLSQRLISAGVENLQMQMGASFAALATGHGIQRLERTLIRSQEANRTAILGRDTSANEASRILARMHGSLWDIFSDLNRIDWSLRLRRWDWKTAEVDEIHLLAQDYGRLDGVQSSKLIGTMRAQMHDETARAAMGKFLLQQPNRVQLEFVRAFCHFERMDENSLNLMLNFSELHPSLRESTRGLLAQEFKGVYAELEHREGFHEAFEERILERWAELIPSVPIETSSSPNRQNHVNRLLRVARKAGDSGHRATLSLATMILKGGWQRDSALVNAYYEHARHPFNNLFLQNQFEAYVARGQVLFRSLAPESQQDVLEQLWNVEGACRWDSRAVFDRMVRALGEPKLQLYYYQRYRGMLEAEDSEAVLFAIRKLGESALPIMDYRDRADLVSRMGRRLADKDGDVVDATCDLFKSYLPTLGIYTDQIVRDLTKVVAGVRNNTLNLQHVDALSHAMPRAHRRDFITGITPTVQYLLLRD